MTQTVQLLANNQFQVIAATPEQVARLRPRLQLVQDGQYIVSILLQISYRSNLEWWGAGVVICLERDADLRMAQLMPLPLTVSCFSKIQIGFTFLVLVVPEKRPLNGCVCVYLIGQAKVLNSLCKWSSDLHLVVLWWMNDDASE